MIPFVIDMMNSVHSLPTNFLTEFIPLVKITRHYFFLLYFNFFSYYISLGKYRGNISVGKIPQKFTDEYIFLIFLFVFIDFLVATDMFFMNYLYMFSFSEISGKLEVSQEF